MPGIERGIGYYLNQPEAEAPKEVEKKDEAAVTNTTETKAQPAPAENKDYVTTLDINGKMQSFRDSGSKFANFLDNAKAVASSVREDFNKVNQLEHLNTPIFENKTPAAAVKEGGVELTEGYRVKDETRSTAETVKDSLELNVNSKNITEAKTAVEKILENLKANPKGNAKKIKSTEHILKSLDTLIPEKEEKLSFTALAELIDIYQPFASKADNEELTNILAKGEPNKEQLDKTAKALDIITMRLKENPIANQAKIEQVTKMKTLLTAKDNVKDFPKEVKKTHAKHVHKKVA